MQSTRIVRLSWLFVLWIHWTLSAQGQDHVQVLVPNGGEIWRTDELHIIRWTGGTGAGVAINLYRGDDVAMIIESAAPNGGSYVWMIPDRVIAGADYRIQVIQENLDSLQDWSDAPFTIVIPPRITITSPNGGEAWQLGSTHDILWTDNLMDSFRVELLRANLPVMTLAEAAPNTGRFSWTVADTLEEADDYRIALTGRANANASDSSDYPFSLLRPPWVQVLQPNGGEVWVASEGETIRWRSGHLGEAEPVRIEFKRNYPGSNWVTLAAATENSGHFLWTVTGPPTTSARIRVRGTLNTMSSDTSDGDFSIVTSLDYLTAPQVVILADSGRGLLAWHAVPGAHRYHVYGAQTVNGARDWLTTTEDTTAVVTLSLLPRRFFVVVAEH